MEGIFVGNSSGAVMAGVMQLADRLTVNDVVVAIFHDHGTRYLGKISAAFYLVVDLLGRQSNRLTKEDRVNILWLNLATAGNWAGLFLALKYLSPPVISALFAGCIPVATLLVNRSLRSKSSLTIADWISTGLLFGCTVIWSSVNVTALSGSGAAIGLAYVVLSSFTIASTTVLSKRLADAKIPTSKIMGHRFYVLIAVSYLMSSPAHELINLVERNYEVLFMVAAIGTILCLWLLQKGIEKCEPVLTEVVIATSPVITLSLYAVLVGPTTIEFDTVVLSIAVVAIAIFHVSYQYKQDSMGAK